MLNSLFRQCNVELLCLQLTAFASVVTVYSDIDVFDARSTSLLERKKSND